MAYFEDLHPCTLFPGEWSHLLAVGWLEKGHDFTTGPLDRELIKALDAASRWSPPGAPGGSHRCDLCPEGKPNGIGSGAHFIPGDGVLYVAPRLITHYMRKHGYVPPAAFRLAALACPQIHTAEYEVAVMKFLVAAPPTPPPVNAYTGPQITVLEGLESVRLRPGMYIGGVDSHGLGHMFFEVVGNSLDEHLAGFASCIQVKVDDLGWTTIEDDGRGIPVEGNWPSDPDLSMLEAVFTRLHTGATLDGHHPHVHLQNGLHGVGIAAVNALCSRLEVETRRAGVAYRAAFEFGRLVEPLVRIGETGLRGTVIRYLPDDEIFNDTARLDLLEVERRFKELARLSPRLELRLQGRSFRQPEGLAGWVRELAPDAVTETALSAFGTANDVEVEVALAWSPSGTRPRLRSFVNYAGTPEAGSHETGLLEAVQAGTPEAASGEHVLVGLVGVVHVGLLHPRFRGPIKAALEVDAARAAVFEVVRGAIAAAPWWWDRIHEHLMISTAPVSRLVVDVDCDGSRSVSVTGLRALLLETSEGKFERICGLDTFSFFDSYGDQHRYTETEAHAWVVDGEVLVHLTSENQWHRRTREGAWSGVPSSERAGLAQKTRLLRPACRPVSIGAAQSAAFSPIAVWLTAAGDQLGGRTTGHQFIPAVPLAQLPPHATSTLYVMFDGAVLMVGERENAQVFMQRLGSDRFVRVEGGEAARLQEICRDRPYAYHGGTPGQR